MAEQQNRRKNHIFQWQFDISVKWLVVIVIMGLVQFGVFLEQFKVLNTNVIELKEALKSGATSAQLLITHDAEQDVRLDEIERRLNHGR